MINAHCEQSSVVYCNETKLYKFRILELSEPFCEVRSGNSVLSRSCDNVTQKLRQAERNKRRSETFHLHTQMRAPNRREKTCNRTQSLPVDLSECGRDHDFLTGVNHVDNDVIHMTKKDSHGREALLKRRMKGFSTENLKHELMRKNIDDNNELRTGEDKHEPLVSPRVRVKSEGSEETGTKPSIFVNDMLMDDQCKQIKSNLHQLSNRFNEKQLETKSKEELISIVLELQDALRIVTED